MTATSCDSLLVVASNSTEAIAGKLIQSSLSVFVTTPVSAGTTAGAIGAVSGNGASVATGANKSGADATSAGGGGTSSTVARITGSGGVTGAGRGAGIVAFFQTRNAL